LKKKGPKTVASQLNSRKCEEVEPELDDVQDSAGPFALVFASGNDWYLKWHDTVVSGFLVVPYSAVGARVGQPDDEVDR